MGRFACALFAGLVAIASTKRAHAELREPAEKADESRTSDPAAPPSAQAAPSQTLVVPTPLLHPAAGIALASTNADTRPKLPKLVVKRWYGWQPLVADAATLTAASAFRSSTILFAGSLLGAPTVHLLHGRPVRALESVGLRLALPAVAAISACALSDSLQNSHDPNGCHEAAAAGALAGLVTAIAIDAAVLSYDPARDADIPLTKTTTTGITPGVSFTSGGARVEVRGSF